MRTWFLGMSLALVLLVAVGAGGILSSPRLPIPEPNTNDQHHGVTHDAEHHDAALLSATWTWLDTNEKPLGIVIAVAALLVATGAAVIGAFLWKATERLAVSTEDLAQAATGQITEMALARNLAERQLDLAEKRFLLTGRQCDLAEKQHGLQRLQYIAEHRPRIRVRSIGLARSPAGLLFQGERNVKGGLVLVNAGASDAKIRQAMYRFFWAIGDLPMVPPLQDDDPVAPLFPEYPHTLEGHGSYFTFVESAALLTDEEAHEIRGGGPTHFYIMGAVLFSDWDLKDRWMGFCREYVAPKNAGGDGRFVPVGNPDYEYED
jgi:hypothetical protein